MIYENAKRADRAKTTTDAKPSEHLAGPPRPQCDKSRYLVDELQRMCQSESEMERQGEREGELQRRHIINYNLVYEL